MPPSELAAHATGAEESHGTGSRAMRIGAGHLSMAKIRGGKYDGSPMKLLPHLLALSGISGLLTAGESGDSVMQSIKAGDYNALMNLPAVRQLLDDPQAREFIQSIMKSKPAAPLSPAPAGRPSPTE